MGLNFEQVWAALMETRASIQELRNENREAAKETDRQIKETERLLKESGTEFDRRMRQSEKDFNRRFGHLDNRFGELVEHLVAPNIAEKFNAFGCHFKEIGPRKFYHDDDTLAAEFDILLANRETLIGIEVKSKPSRRDVEDHINRLEFLREYQDNIGDKREIRGAIAGAIMPQEVRQAAFDAGLYVIEQSGDTVKIKEPPHLRGW
jgi:hypothetical protein